jgi:DNA (cytosine-5)-methyltransferase 1
MMRGSTKAYYNEIDKGAAEWLRALITEGVIADGDVDERSIEDVRPGELVGYTQCHFFAGIGGWSYALRLAGWPDHEPVWTGSCPCQPFSAAGQGAGFDDPRHLWPAFEWHIRQCKPRVVFGEQVSSPAGLNWLDVVFADLESQGYSAAALDLSAASVGAPHIRQRLFWVGDTDLGRRQAGNIAAAPNRHGHSAVTAGSDDSWLGYAGSTGLEGWSVSGSGRSNQRTAWTPSDFVWCRDEVGRPVEPGTFPLVDGFPERMGLLRGYGNAIVPQVAAEFIRCYVEAQ